MDQYENIIVERRDAARLVVNLDVLLHRYRTTPILCMMHDVSTGGALLTMYADHELAAGDEILVDASTAEFVATIAWVAKDSCGIRFHRRLYAAEVAALLTVPSSDTPRDHTEQDQTARDLSTREQMPFVPTMTVDSFRPAMH